jgi:ABC-type phosphate transport system substrate-binding protein
MFDAMNKGLLAIVALVLAVILICPPARAGELYAPVDNAFSDPGKIKTMPAGWEKQPIKYDISSGGADLVVSLDQQMYRILMPAIMKYAKQKDIRIIVHDGTCGNAAGLLARKKSDIGAFCCPPSVSDRLPGLSFITLGITPVAILVHPDNPVDGLSLDQAKRVFSGDIHRWSETRAGDGTKGANIPIRPIGRLHCKKRPGHWRLLLDNEEMFSPDLLEVGTIPDMISAVSASPRAIGHASHWLAVEHYRNYGNVKILRIDGFDPGKLGNVSSGKYPLYKTFSITLWEGENVANTHARDLVKYLLGYVERMDTRFKIVPPSALRKAGWRFRERELIGGP